MIWENISGYEGKYQINSNGEIKTFGRNIKGRTIKQSRHKKRGYLHVGLWKDGVMKNKDIHRLVAETFIPNPKNKPQVNHKDGNKLNNNVDNLEWVTQTENMIHAAENGLGMRGKLNGRAKLSESQVKEIRGKYKPYNFIELAKEYGMSKPAIQHIVYGTTWKHI